MPKVSVIIPIYNVEQYIEHCARTLFEQTLQDIEFIFIDDCSTDKSVIILKKILRDYPTRENQVIIKMHNVNKGVSYVRNEGLKIANGEYVAYCDSDDWVNQDMYEKLYNEAKRVNADVCYCDFNVVNNEFLTYRTVDCCTNKTDFLKKYICEGLTVLWNMLVKQSLYKKHHIQCIEGITYCEDFWLSILIFYYAKKIVKISEPLYNYNQMNLSSLLHTNNEKVMSDQLVYYGETIEFLRKEGVLNQFHRELCWRILKCKQDLVLNSKEHSRFLNIYPKSHSFILSCPKDFCNSKIKIMMWLLVHKMEFIVVFLNKLRSYVIK